MISNEGTGWRLVNDPSRKHFPFLVAGSDWAFELSSNEWNSLVNTVIDLVAQHKELENQLMQEEKVYLELERSPWWACIDGNRDEWSLTLILLGDGIHRRGCEFSWPMPTAQIVAFNMREMWDCSK
mgnify:CR=1 FL=1|tara:strand:+ start:695 stop:1072 length:378 start_codon:yes stop_codon:yes gene_type:complete